MKKYLWSVCVFLGMSTTTMANPANLITVYQQALVSDPIYQQALSQRLSNKQGVPISLSSLLPTASILAFPSVTKTIASGDALSTPTDTTRAYAITLSISQTIFDFGKLANLSGAKSISKQADATLNAATQNLMIRVASAYFAVLKDEEFVVFNRANKDAFAKQLDQIEQQYKVGLKTVTDVYTAQASYDTAAADYIAAQTQLENDKENLRAITGESYSSFAKLSEKFPLISPQPTDMEAWVQTAEQQNWQVKSAEYANAANLAAIKQQFAGNLPTLNAGGNFVSNYARNTNNSTLDPAGATKWTDRQFNLSLNIPIVSGGLVTAQTEQARYNYQVSSQFLEQTLRSTINTTRQSYLGIISGIRQVQADKQAIKSNLSSLRGLNAGYHVGTQTLVDVLNQQQKVFQALTQYATDRYAYVNNLLALKNAAGTLSQQDLEAINSWLEEKRTSEYSFLKQQPKEETPPDTTQIKTHRVKTVAQKPKSEQLILKTVNRQTTAPTILAKANTMKALASDPMLN